MATLVPAPIELDHLRALLSMSGGNGSKIYGIAAHTGLSLSAISVREADTAFASLVATGPGAALALGDFYLNGTIPNTGDLLVPPPGYRFTAFELSAGSVQAN